MASIPDEAVQPDHLARHLGGRVVSLLFPVSLVVGVVVWSTANLSPIYAALADVNGVVPPGDRDDNSGGADIATKLLSSAMEAVALVAMVLLTTLVVLLLYYCRCHVVLYGWLMFSAVSIFFVMAWVWLDLVLTRFQIPYSVISMGVVLWNTAVAGTACMFFYAHPVLTQGSLLFASVLVAWSLTALPAWTAWSVLIAIAVYDVAAVMCPYGPLRLLIHLAQDRGDPIPGFVYDTEQDVRFLAQSDTTEGVERSRPRRTPGASQTLAPAVTQKPQRDARGEAARAGRVASSTAVPIAPQTRAYCSREEEPRVDQVTEFAEDVLPDPAALTGEASCSSPPTVVDTTRTTAADTLVRFDSLPAHEKVLILSRAPFKLGLGDFIFYSMLVGEAYRAGSAVAWIAPFLVVLSGMIITLMMLLFRMSGGALPALPVSIFAATLMFVLCRVSLSSLVDGAASLNLVL